MLEPRDLPLLAVFAAVARLGSFTAAARELRLTKSVVSHHVMALEERCGVRLLERTTRKLRITQIGERVLATSKRVVEASRDVNLLLESHRAAPSGTLRVTAPHVLRDSLVAPSVARLLSIHPQLQAEMILDDSAHDLVGERIDVAVRLGPFPESGLIVRRLGTDPEIIVASAAADGLQISAEAPASLAGAAWIGHAVLDPGATKTFRTEAGRTERVNVNQRVVVTTAEAMRTLAIAGTGLTILPLHMVRDAIAAGKLVRVCPLWHRRKITLQLVTTTRLLPPRVTAFMAIARDAARDLGF